MRKLAAALGALALVVTMSVTATAGARGTGGSPLSAALSGANEVSPTNPHGDNDRGSVALTLNQGQGRICWTFGAITLTAGDALPDKGHIHKAPAGVTGGVVVTLFNGPDAPTAYPTGTVCVSAAKDLVKDIRKNPDQFYVNLHNAQHPAGVMRGQLG